MYSHIAKGLTIGHLVTRRVFRTITGVPGLLIDLIAALFWVPHYSAYWKDTEMTYAYGEKVSGMQGVFGWIGETLGFVIGAPLGGLIGFCLYIPHRLVQAVNWLYTQVENLCEFIAQDLAQRPLITNGWVFKAPRSWGQKSANIYAVTLGTVTALPFWLAAKGLEFVFQARTNEFSQGVWSTASWFGLALGVICLSIPSMFMQYSVGRLRKVGHALHNATVKTTAFIYAKGNEEPQPEGHVEECCFTGNDLHSQAFRKLHAQYKKTATLDILFGQKGAKHYQSPFLRPLHVEVPVHNQQPGRQGEPSPP